MGESPLEPPWPLTAALLQNWYVLSAQERPGTYEVRHRSATSNGKAQNSLLHDSPCRAWARDQGEDGHPYALCPQRSHGRHLQHWAVVGSVEAEGAIWSTSAHLYNDWPTYSELHTQSTCINTQKNLFPPSRLRICTLTSRDEQQLKTCGLTVGWLASSHRPFGGLQNGLWDDTLLPPSLPPPCSRSNQDEKGLVYSIYIP